MTTAEKTPKTESVRLRVTSQELEWLRAYADRNDRSMSSVLRLALKQFYDREMK